MSRNVLYITASLLILLALGLIVVGLRTSPILWYLGLGAVALAMMLSLATHWAHD